MQLKTTAYILKCLRARTLTLCAHDTVENQKNANKWSHFTTSVAPEEDEGSLSPL